MKTTFLFQRGNYVLMLAGIALIVLGFVLMSGGGSEDPNVYNPELFSARRIVVAPFLIVVGFAVEVWAIMRKPKAE
jgi:membrane-bound ClpP family serine protease